MNFYTTQLVVFNFLFQAFQLSIVLMQLVNGEVYVAHTAPAWFISGVTTSGITVAGGTMPMAWAYEINMFAQRSLIQ